MAYFADMKPFVLFGSLILSIAVLMSAVAFINQNDEIPEKHIEVVLREAGHELLLSAKDSTSRVLPVKKLNGHTYQLSFQNEVSFISDTLINIIQRTFSKNGLDSSYIVNLKNCEQKETVLAFEVNGKTGDLIPCRGRRLSIGCYVIEIDLMKEDRFNPLWFLLLIIPFAIAGYYMKDKVRKMDESQPITDNNNYIPLGIFKFYADNNVLKNGNNDILLSEKETKALKIFADNINQIVERETLMKEIWEDEGTIVISRNVDVLVSKLRKKLSDDSSLKFVNVHGRGYKFMIG